MARTNGAHPRGVDPQQQVARRNGGAGLVGSLLSIGGRIDREAKTRVFGARTSASEAWDRLETVIAQRVARALNALQIPTARDVRELNERVEALQKAVVALERRAAEAATVQPRVQARRKATARVRTAGAAKK
jgi:polyhydroxyalkanoate synthesis regulator phasin